MQPRPLALPLALLLIIAAALAPTDVAATQPKLDPFERIPAAGAGPDGTEFLGTLDVLHFEACGSDLVAVGTLSGRPPGPSARPRPRWRRWTRPVVSVPVKGVTATCERLEVDFGRVALDLHGPAVAIDPIRVDGTIRPEHGGWPEQELCAIADRLRGDAAPRPLAGLLDAVARSFD